MILEGTATAAAVVKLGQSEVMAPPQLLWEQRTKAREVVGSAVTACMQHMRTQEAG